MFGAPFVSGLRAQRIGEPPDARVDRITQLAVPESRCTRAGPARREAMTRSTNRIARAARRIVFDRTTSNAEFACAGLAARVQRISASAEHPPRRRPIFLRCQLAGRRPSLCWSTAKSNALAGEPSRRRAVGARRLRGRVMSSPRAELRAPDCSERIEPLVDRDALVTNADREHLRPLRDKRREANAAARE